MASTTGTHPYTFQRASTMATRSLVSDTKPTETPSASSNDGVDGRQSQPVLHSKQTDNYERAAADAAKNGTVGGASTVSGTDRPSGFARQQSWDMRDMKRVHHEAMLGQAAGGRGYSSTDGAQQ